MSDRRERMDDPQTTMMGILEQWQAGLWTALPAQITKITQFPDQVTVECQPTIQCKFHNRDGTFDWVSMPVCSDVPVVFPSGGGFTLTFPLKIGDEVLLVFANRCIDAWWQNGGLQNQVEFRMHDLSDGFALPGPRSQPKVPAGPINLNNVQLRNDAGDTFVEIEPSKQINIVSPTRVEVHANYVEISAAQDLFLNASTIHSNAADWYHEGNMHVNGNASFIGGTLTHNGKDTGSTHKHSGVTIGGGQTGVPV